MGPAMSVLTLPRVLTGPLQRRICKASQASCHDGGWYNRHEHMHVKELFDGLLVLLAGVTLRLQLCHVCHPINNISTLFTQWHVKGTT